MLPSQIIDHRTRSPPLPPRPFKNETGFRPVNLCPPAAPSGQYSVARHQTGSREQGEKSLLLWLQSVTLGWTSWRFSWALNRYCVGLVGILMCNCSLTWANGLRVIKNGQRTSVKGALSKSINKFIPNESWQPLSLLADTRWAGEAQVVGKMRNLIGFLRKDWVLCKGFVGQ